DKDNIQPLSKELEGHEVMWLVNSAGVGKSGSFESLSLEDISSLIDINIKALTLMTSMCLPYCIENSKIVNLASSAAFLPQPNFAVYAASKRYVLNFSRALAEEVKSKNISVTAVCPGPVKTEFLSLSGIPKYKEKFAVEAEAVVNQAMKDIKKGKRISIYSLPMKVVHVISKLIPTDLILKFYQ
ncbi:MAG: SDR family NAD(P)-dependent oxidoreductase, partial [Erysipelotrichaceae bacterium]|nr:SDR family NAD(P)-dependent oxidoreductase [Erysipelotrichaceae bacterium]